MLDVSKECEDFTFDILLDVIVCGYPTGSVDVNNHNWPLIVAERRRLGRILTEDDLKYLLE